jgi:hypothetical protein
MAKNEETLKSLARAASDKYQAEETFEFMLAAVRNTGRQLQLMINAIVVMQEAMPMPADSWEQFKRDIEYTNEKHGLNLIV